MTLEQLRHFYQTAKRGNIGKAAEAMRISPSAISYSIDRLEDEIGVELFFKRGKRIFLTPQGQKLFESYPELEDKILGIKSYVRGETKELKGHYVIGATHLICAEIVAPLMGRLRVAHPGISFELFTMRSSQVIAGVSEGSIHFGVCFNPVKSAHLEIDSVMQGSLLIGVRKKHPILNERDNLSKLNSYGAVLPRAFAGVDVCESHPVFKQYGIVPKIGAAIDSYEVAIKLIENSNDWSFLPDFVIEANKSRICKIAHPRAWNPQYDLSIVTQRGRQLDQVINLLKSELQKINSRL